MGRTRLATAAKDAAGGPPIGPPHKNLQQKPRQISPGVRSSLDARIIARNRLSVSIHSPSQEFYPLFRQRQEAVSSVAFLLGLEARSSAPCLIYFRAYKICQDSPPRVYQSGSVHGAHPAARRRTPGEVNTSIRTHHLSPTGWSVFASVPAVRFAQRCGKFLGCLLRQEPHSLNGRRSLSSQISSAVPTPPVVVGCRRQLAAAAFAKRRERSRSQPSWIPMTTPAKNASPAPTVP